MPVRRYRTEINGSIRAGLEFDSDVELEQFLLSRGIVLVYAPTAAAPSAVPAERGQWRPSFNDEPRTRGRPSFDPAIAAAVAALETKLADCDTPSERARLVLRHMAKSHAAEDLPGTRTVIRFLTERPGEKQGNKCGQKSKRARIHRT